LGPLAARLPQHSDQHRSQHPILLAVDQQLGEGAGLGGPQELSDPLCPIEVRQRQDVEQLGAGSGAEGVQARSEAAPDVLEVYVDRTLAP
jgi:hypothetical protein